MDGRSDAARDNEESRLERQKSISLIVVVVMTGEFTAAGGVIGKAVEQRSNTGTRTRGKSIE